MKNSSRPDVLAIIPARGGSKGVPRKNIRSLLGLPLIAWSIRHAQQSTAITRCIVSTEDAEIAEVAKKYGAEVVERPTDLASDTAATEPVMLHVLEHLDQTENYQPDWVVLLQATSPIRTPDLIDRAISKAGSDNYDSLLTVTPVNRFFWKERSGAGESLYDFRHRPRRQDIRREDRFFEENGNVYVTSRQTLLAEKNRLGGRVALLETSELEALEIDTETDWRNVEIVLAESGLYPDWLLPDTIDLVIFDFDGVMTNNTVLTDTNGLESVSCDRGDGYGVDLMRKAGIPMMIMSTEINKVVQARANKLKIEVFQGIDDKKTALRRLFDERNINADHVLFVGNDINDLPAFEAVGCPIAVNDALPEVRRQARLVLSKPGGRGAVRELADMLLRRWKSKSA